MPSDTEVPMIDESIIIEDIEVNLPADMEGLGF